MDVFVAVLTVSALTVAGGISYIGYRITHRPPPPPISDYERHKRLFMMTGDEKELQEMEKAFEKEDHS